MISCRQRWRFSAQQISQPIRSACHSSRGQLPTTMAVHRGLILYIALLTSSQKPTGTRIDGVTERRTLRRPSTPKIYRLVRFLTNNAVEIEKYSWSFRLLVPNSFESKAAAMIAHEVNLVTAVPAADESLTDMP